MNVYMVSRTGATKSFIIFVLNNDAKSPKYNILINLFNPYTYDRKKY